MAVLSVVVLAGWVPALVRWPVLVQPHTEINGIFTAEDWVQTLMAAAGEPDIKDKLLQGYDTGGKNFRVHLDDYDQRDPARRQRSRQASRILLLDRRRQPRRAPLRPVQGGVHGTLEAGGTLENAQAMAAHESPRTTKLYDRTGDEITLDEVERITI